MKIFCRIIGAILGLTGLVFIVLPLAVKPDSVLVPVDWRSVAQGIGLGVLFLLGACYFFRLDIDAIDDDDDRPPTAFTQFLIRNAWLLRLVAQLGFLGSLALLGFLCLGAAVPSWLDSVAFCAAVALNICCIKIVALRKSQNLGWVRMSPNARRYVPRFASVVLLAGVLLGIANALTYKDPFYTRPHRLLRGYWLVVTIAAFAAAASSPGQRTTAPSQDQVTR
jgi:hypothetical protein